jgi:hypothetical protein
MRFSSTVSSATTNVTSNGETISYTVTVQYPGWVGILYWPAFWLSGTELGNATYGVYLQWWEKHPDT